MSEETGWIKFSDKLPEEGRLVEWKNEDQTYLYTKLASRFNCVYWPKECVWRYLYTHADLIAAQKRVFEYTVERVCNLDIFDVIDLDVKFEEFLKQDKP